MFERLHKDYTDFGACLSIRLWPFGLCTAHSEKFRNASGDAGKNPYS